MKFQFQEKIEPASFIAGSIICKGCYHTYPCFSDEGEFVICPECDTKQENPFYLRPKERKRDKRSLKGG